MTQALIIADSKNEFGNRITTFILTFPRYLLAEVNTHRMMSRNSASSRAIRFEKMVESVMTNPFIPKRWQKDHSGMQGTEYLTDIEEIKNAEIYWLKARDEAVNWATGLNNKGITKQLCNRLLEPFMWHTCLLTGTEFENFTALRAEGMAEDNFQELAFLMLQALNQSEPKQLKARELHIPFGDKFNFEGTDIFNYNVKDEMLKVKLATVRCARISYLTQGKETSIEEDLKLHDRLALSGHWSAFEHCAQAMTEKEYNSHMVTNRALVYKDDYIPQGTLLHHERVIDADSPEFGWCGNFRGFIQYRKMFPDENRTDSRLLKK